MTMPDSNQDSPVETTVDAPDVSVEAPGKDVMERRNPSLDRLFSETPEPASQPKAEQKPEKKTEPAKKVTKTKEVEPETEDSGDSEDEQNDDSQDDDTDFDAPVTDEEPEETEDPEPESGEDYESIARRTAKEKGREVKKLSKEIKSKDLEIASVKLDRDNLKEKNEKLETQLKELKIVKIKPEDDPDYVRLRSEVMETVEVQADTIPEAKDVPKYFGHFVGAFLEAKAKGGAEGREIRAQLKQDIIKKCGNYDVPYEDLLEDEKKEADKMAASVLKLIVDNSGKAEELVKLTDRLAHDSEIGSHVLREREYKETAAKLQPVLDELGDLDDELLKDNPHSLQALVVGRIKSSPAAKTRSDKVKEEIFSAFAGPKALTKSEVAKLKANGTNIKEFEAARREKHEARVQKIVGIAYWGAMGLSLVPEKLKKLAELQGDADAEDSEDEVIRKQVKKPAAISAPKEKRPSERSSYGLGRFMD